MYVFDSLIDAGARVAAMSDEGEGDCGWPGAADGTRAAFLRHFEIAPDHFYGLRQIHGSHVATIERGTAGSGAQVPEEALGDGDGLITNVPGIALGITVADCVPLLLFDPATRCVAALHAGREGTAAQIAAVGVARIVKRFGARATDIRAVIGPSAGPCCYEVSETMAAQWLADGWVAHGRYLDLWASNAAQLRACGLQNAHITISGHCTLCMGQFHSYRRERTACRNLALIMA